MDYEKKYDELIAKIESVKKDPKIGLKDGDYYNGYVQKGIRSALDYLLQEESEDERIRKAISAAICGTTAETVLEANGAKLVDALAYLEKQKEQKPNIELIQKSWYLEGYHDGKYNNEPKWLIQTGEGGPRYEENPKYGTQKPAEWSEEDEQWLESIIKDYEDNFTKDKDHAAVIKIKIDFLKSLRPQPCWKPSDEQMEALMLAIEGECPPTSYMSRRLEDLYDGLVNTFDVDEKYLGNNKIDETD